MKIERGDICDVHQPGTLATYTGHRGLYASQCLGIVPDTETPCAVLRIQANPQFDQPYYRIERLRGPDTGYGQSAQVDFMTVNVNEGGTIETGERAVFLHHQPILEQAAPLILQDYHNQVAPTRTLRIYY